MHLLVTCPSGFEVEARRELEQILGKNTVSMTYFCGLLKVETPLEDGLEKLREVDTSFISKAVPIQRITRADINSIKEFFEKTCKNTLQGFSVRCKRRGSHSFSSMDVEVKVGSMLTQKGSKVDLTSPKTILWVDIIQERAHLSVLSPKDILKKTPGVQRRWKKGERPISRSELKMREIVEAFPEGFKKDNIAIDIGAAPGGWSKVMASRIKKVFAVDRAELDSGVKGLKNVVHIKERAENLDIGESVDILTNDANLLHMQSAEISIKLAKSYLKEGGTLIHTVKLGTVPNTGNLAAKSLNHAAREVREEFEKARITVKLRKLKYNTRNETTIIGRK
ncbi:MAG: THUMP domain-containing protein [Candidatus Hydrothermarchaeaceae archaeon]